MSITLNEALNLKVGTIIYHTENRNADGTPQRWKINGKVKTWKRAPEKIQIPIKNGMRNFGYLTEYDLDKVSLVEHVPAKNVGIIGSVTGKSIPIDYGKADLARQFQEAGFKVSQLN